MAIYGHMNKNQSPQDDQDPPPEKTDKLPFEETEIDDTISSLLQEAEDTVKHTQQSVTEESRTSLEENTPSSAHHATQETDQHFTIANSPTRFQQYKDSTTKE